MPHLCATKSVKETEELAFAELGPKAMQVQKVSKSAACLLVCTVKIQTYPNHGSSQTNRKYIINANGVRQGHGMHPTLNKRRLAQDNHKLFYAFLT